jgi:hypothetical protein
MYCIYRTSVTSLHKSLRARFAPADGKGYLVGHVAVTEVSVSKNKSTEWPLVA